MSSSLDEEDELNSNSKIFKMELPQWTRDDGLPIAGPSSVARSDSKVSALHCTIYKIYIVIYYVQVPDSDSADGIGSTHNTFAVASAATALLSSPGPLGSSPMEETVGR